MAVRFLSLGFQVAHWIETLLVHGPGDVQGDDIALEQDLYEALVKAYELRPDGRRKVRRYHLWRAKGRAKSEFAGMVVCAEALGPVRFSHFAVPGEVSWWGYEYDDGEPVGRPVTYPFIRCLATEESQSGNTYDNVQYMLSNGPITEAIAGIDAGLTRTFLPGSGEIRPSTSKSASKDGGKETFAVYNESHLYVLPDHHRMYDTVRRNLRKRKAAEGWFLDTSTMFLPGEGSVAEGSFLFAEQVSEGTVRDDGMVFDYQAGPDMDSFDFDNDKELEAALREAYAPADWLDFEGLVAEARDPQTDKADFIRYFLNRPAGSAEAVYPMSDWDQLFTKERFAPGDPIVVMFDGSDNGDSTGIVGLRADGVYQKLGVWEKPTDRRAKDWEVPRVEVNERVAEIMDTYRVARFYADPPYWQTDIDRWASEYGDKVMRFSTASDKRMAEASERFVTMCNAGELRHQDDKDLRRHLGAARRHRNRSGWRPVKKKYDVKIDLVVCLIGAVQALGDAIKADELSPDAELVVELW